MALSALQWNNNTLVTEPGGKGHYRLDAEIWHAIPAIWNLCPPCQTWTRISSSMYCWKCWKKSGRSTPKILVPLWWHREKWQIELSRSHSMRPILYIPSCKYITFWELPSHDGKLILWMEVDCLLIIDAR